MPARSGCSPSCWSWPPLSAVAAVAHWLGHLSWPMAFVLGTAVGPTDASAATSIARRLGLPRRLVTILEGEALFNDATALVLYAAAVAAATSGHFSVARTAAIDRVLDGGRGGDRNGRRTGSAAGCATGSTTRRSRSPARSCWPTSPICRPQAIHASGVLAAVTAGLYLGWHSSGGAFSARSRLQSAAFWETLVFLVNAALFVLVGLSFHTFSTQARGPVGRLVLTGVAVVSTVIVVRLAWMWAFGWLIRPEAPRPGGHRPARLARTADPRLVGHARCYHAGCPAGGAGDDRRRSTPWPGATTSSTSGFAVIIVTLVGAGHDPARPRTTAAPERAPLRRRRRAPGPPRAHHRRARSPRRGMRDR